MEPWMLWLIAAVVTLAVELTTGTFYLLVVGLAAGVTAAVAAFDGGLGVQLALFAALVIGGWAIVWRVRGKQRSEHVQPILDRGERVEVLSWLDPNRCTVRYRGALWTARLKDGRSDRNRYVVSRIDGTLLEIAPEP